MFLSLGGSRRSSSGIANGQKHGSPAQEFQQAGGDRGADRLQGAATVDPLQALATGKYGSASRGSSSLPPLQKSLIRSSESFPEEPMLAPPISTPFVSNPEAYNPLQGFAPSGSPRSTLPPFLGSPSLPSLSRETTRLSSDSGSLHGVTGGEEVLSRDRTRFEQQPPLRRSSTIVLAKKLKDSLGDKLADSLREKIKEVVKRKRVEDGAKQDGGEAWPELEEIAGKTSALSRSESDMSRKSWDGCWPAKKTGSFPAAGNGSFESTLAALESTPGPEDCLKRSFGGSGEHSKVLSWSPQENLPQARIAMANELLCNPASEQLGAPRYAWDAGRSAQDSSRFFASQHSSLLEASEGAMSDLIALLKQTTESRPPSTRAGGVRKHVFPEAAAMGTCRPDSNPNPNPNPRQSSSILRPTPSIGDLYSSIDKINDHGPSLTDVLKAFHHNSGHECASSSLLSFPNPSRELKDAELGLQKLSGRPSITTLQDDARQRLFGKYAAESSDSVPKVGGSWQVHAPSSSYTTSVAMMQLPGFDLSSPREGEFKTAHSSHEASPSVQFPKRQCVESSSLGLDFPSSIGNGDGGLTPKSDAVLAGFDQYMATLTAVERVPSYDLADASLSTLFEEFGP